MIERRSVVVFASAAALTLAMSQGWSAETTTSGPAAGTPSVQAAPVESTSTQTAPAPAPAATEAHAPPPAQPEVSASPEPPAPPPSMTAARERMEKRQAEMMKERGLRYDELRARAAEVGLELPETPPWEQAGMQPPEMPMPADMPAPPKMPEHMGMPTPPDMMAPAGSEGRAAMRGGKTQEEWDAMREQRYQAMRERAEQRGMDMPEMPPWMLMSQEEREAHWEKMRNMTPEQRQAEREQHWQEMRERAKAQGIDFPEQPPWKQAEQRREEMQARWEQYRSVVEEMSEQQREAAEAIFGQANREPPLPPQMPPRMPMQQTPYGGDYGAPMRPMMPGYGGQGVGPSGYEWGSPGRWYGSDEGMYPTPPVPEAGYGQPW